MKWTRIMPPQRGYYWIRKETDPKDFMVCAFMDVREGKRALFWPGVDGAWIPDGSEAVAFYGPLQQPEVP